ncbi:hypothetical protein [Eisenbergiella sp.]
MISTSIRLLRIQLQKDFGINEVMHCRDAGKKRKLIFMLCIFILVGAVLAFYTAGAAWVLCVSGAQDSVPGFVVAVSSMAIFIFTLFKAGPVLFAAGDYEMLTALPLKPSAIIMSRLLHMYLSSLFLSALTMVPVGVVYGLTASPSPVVYVLMLISLFFVPLVPLTVASLVGTLIMAAGSRVQRKNLVIVFLSMTFTLGILAVTMIFSSRAENMELQDMAGMIRSAVEQVNGMYPLTGLYTSGITGGNPAALAGFAVISLGIFLLFIALVQWKYVKISSALRTHEAKKNYRLQGLKQRSMLGALYKKEIKRYFASNIYVMNTMVGYILMVAASVGLAVAGMDKLESYLQMEGMGGMLPFNPGSMIPFILALMVMMGGTTSSSISIEGKQWWIPKSLPIPSGLILDSKMLVNLTLAVPSILLAGTILTVSGQTGGLKPVWVFLVPLAYACFSSVLGITINLKMPVFNWDNETTIVKQSASTFVSVLGGMLLALLPIGLRFALAGIPADLFLGGVTALVIVVTVILYGKNRKCDLQKIG